MDLRLFQISKTFQKYVIRKIYIFQVHMDISNYTEGDLNHIQIH